jgi:hypothetical protein
LSEALPLICDSNSKTVDHRHQTEDPEGPEMMQREKSNSETREIHPLSEVKEGQFLPIKGLMSKVRSPMSELPGVDATLRLNRPSLLKKDEICYISGVLYL